MFLFQVALLLVFRVFPVQEPTALGKPLLATCVVQDACSLLQRSGVNGIRRSILARSMSYNPGFHSAHSDLQHCNSQLMPILQTLRYNLCSSSFLSPLSSPRSWPPNLHRPGSSPCHLILRLRSCVHREDLRSSRPPQSRWCRPRHQQSQGFPQAPSR